MRLNDGLARDVICAEHLSTEAVSAFLAFLLWIDGLPEQTFGARLDAWRGEAR